MKVIFGPATPAEEDLIINLVRDCQVVYLEMNVCDEFDKVVNQIRDAIVKEKDGSIAQSFSQNGDVTLKVKVGA